MLCEENHGDDHPRLAMGCVLFMMSGLREVFGKDDRNRRKRVGNDVSILNEARSQLNRCFPSCPHDGCAIYPTHVYAP